MLLLVGWDGLRGNLLAGEQEDLFVAHGDDCSAGSVFAN